jgi:hypothetical protein
MMKMMFGGWSMGAPPACFYQISHAGAALYLTQP